MKLSLYYFGYRPKHQARYQPECNACGSHIVADTWTDTWPEN